MDKVSPEKRSEIMARIRSENTKPEIKLRSFLHKAGFRFRIHPKKLPGRPDIVLKKYNVAIFVHGCFWHQHTGCKLATIPKTRIEYWSGKFERNIERDKRVENELANMGWRVLVVWECELMRRDETRLGEIVEWICRGQYDWH